MEELKELMLHIKINYPHLYEEALELYYLCLDEIEQGGSESNEVSLAIRDLKELIK